MIPNLPEKAKQIIAARFGFTVTDKRGDAFCQALENRRQTLQLPTVDQYLTWLLANEEHPEWVLLVGAITIKETFFFRNPRQFVYLQQQIIPEHVQRYGKWGWSESGVALPGLHILSAGCASGEEPYSIAMCIAGAIQHRRSWDIQIHALDVSADALETAKAGCYALSDRLKAAVNALNPEYLTRYFEQTTAGLGRVKDEIRQMVTFKHGNMMRFFLQPTPAYHLIFCRNVLIYLSVTDQATLVQKLTGALHPGGYLMTGDAEPLHFYPHDLRLVESDAGGIYQKPIA